jgi:hypothetical protein
MKMDVGSQTQANQTKPNGTDPAMQCNAMDVMLLK